MKIKRLLTVLLSGIFGLGCMSMFAGCNKNVDPYTFTQWMSGTENSEFYTNYSENPGYKYVSNYKTFADSNGEQKNIKIEFSSSPTGSEQDNFNLMLSTGTYTDLLDLSYFMGSVVELYENGQILDLTPYVNETTMPNYTKFLKDHPEEAKYAVNLVNGEKKYLQFYQGNDEISYMTPWQGYAYRRDWVYKYGKDPVTGASFTGGAYTLDKDGKTISVTSYNPETVNGDSWVDNVKFPSWYYDDSSKWSAISSNTGVTVTQDMSDFISDYKTKHTDWTGSDPVTISDWEWMFDIFEKAISGQNINDGYPLSLYYPGFMSTGDMYTAFGGGSILWYKDGDTAKFGATAESTKSYIEATNNWWKNDWIDKQFSTRTSDMFYRIDDVTVRQGKVGLWMASISTLGTRIYSADHTNTKDIVVYGAAQPINDIYGHADTKFKEPKTMYQTGLFGASLAITDKAKGKDLTLLINYIDYMYGEEGTKIKSLGLSKAQFEECQDPFYIRYGLTNGAYTESTVDEKTYYTRVPLLDANDGNIESAVRYNRSIGLHSNGFIKRADTPSHINSLTQWIKYTNSGYFNTDINSQRTASESKEYSSINNKIGVEYLEVVMPQFIKGTKTLSKDWNNFVSDINKRNPKKVTDVYQRIINDFK